VAPNTRSQNILTFEDMFQEPLKKQALIKNQNAILSLEPGTYQSLLYEDKSHCIRN
jgi:hypothetical protein